jgi:aminopeptidase N
VHTKIALHVDLEEQAAKGVVTHRVRSKAAGALMLMLHGVDLTIQNVFDAELGEELEYAYDGAELKVSWPKAWAVGEERHVSVAYRVDRPRSGLFFSKPTAKLPRAPLFAATDHETERARYWLPCVDLPNVRATLEFELRAAQALTVLANGAYVGEQAHEDGTKTVSWRLDWPCPSYILCFAIGDFTEAKDGEFEGIPLAYYGASSRTQEQLKRSFGRTGEMLAWMTKRLGHSFPFPKYYQFALPDFGGAMENISLVAWDDVFVLDETLAQEWTWLVDQVNVHEMAHSYFGDAVVCRDYAHAWLKESWATYMEQCWLEDKYGADEMNYDFWRNQQAYFMEADHSYKRPIVTRKFESSWQMYDRHLYPGGGARLHMLRKLLGDEVFWSAVNQYLGEYMGKTVETEDFRRVLERVSGRSLVQFFDQWIYTASYPSLKVAFQWDKATKLGTFTITQLQASKGSEPVFEVETELGWRVDGEDHVAGLVLDKAVVMHTVSMPKKPEFIRFDPLNRTVAKVELAVEDEFLRAMLVGASDIIGRIQAAHALGKTGKRANLKALEDAYGQEAFWGVREQIAAALGESQTEYAAEILVRLVDAEQSPMVLEPLIRATAQYREPELAAAVTERLVEGLPYRASAAAYHALGELRADAPLERLTEAARLDQFCAFPQAAALRALAATRRAEVIDTLIEQSRPDATQTIARAAALQALGDLSRYVERRDRERIIDHLTRALRDPEARARAGAAQGLFTARASSAYYALMSWRNSLAKQEQPSADKQLANLLKSEHGEVKALEGKVEELTTKLRAMTERLDKLEHTEQNKDKASDDEAEHADEDAT